MNIKKASYRTLYKRLMQMDHDNSKSYRKFHIIGQIRRRIKDDSDTSLRSRRKVQKLHV